MEKFMTDKIKKVSDGIKPEDKSISRRAMFKSGVAAGVAVAVAPTEVMAKSSRHTHWDYVADVVVIGAGCSGLPAAIRARDAGLSVILIDQNFDVGGKMLHSGAQVSLGGGDPVQLRDIKGLKDKEGFLDVPPMHKPEEMTEDVDFLFRDMTDWSVIDNAAQAPYRFNERDLHRAWADNCAGARQFLIDNYVRFGRISGTHPGGGISRARRAVAFLMLGSKTDIKAGTVTRQDAGIVNKSSSAFAPRIMMNTVDIPKNAVSNGAALARGLEFSAREKGAQFMLNRRMTELIREQPFSGRVIGVRASYTPRFDPVTGKQLESYFSNGNVVDRSESITIRARKAVMLSSGGMSGNPQFRSMFYPGFRDPAYGSSAAALLGKHGQDASGQIAALRIGANLAGMQQNLHIGLTGHIPARIGTEDSYTDMYPGHPTFTYRGSTGISMGLSSYAQLIAVNQVGQRFYNEMDLVKNYNTPVWPGGKAAGSPTHSMQHVQGDWRNCHPTWIGQQYNRYTGIDAALQINEGSTSPDFYAGPSWAIFDQGTVERDKSFTMGYPWLTNNGCFFQADTIEELADKIMGYKFQRVKLKHLADTVKKWNGFVDGGADPEFGRGKDAPMYKLNKAPFYAALIAPTWHDSYGGIRINGKAEAIDMEGRPIPGLYAGGEVSGGGSMHGLGRCLVHGFIAGGSIAALP